MRIRHKLPILLAGIALIPPFFVGLITLKTVSRTMFGILDDKAVFASRVALNTLVDYRQTIRTQGESLLKDPDIVLYLRTAKTDFLEQILALKKTELALTKIYFIAKDGSFYGPQRETLYGIKKDEQKLALLLPADKNNQKIDIFAAGSSLYLREEISLSVEQAPLFEKLVLEKVIDHVIADYIKSISGVDISFVFHKKMVATSIADSQGNRVPYLGEASYVYQGQKVEDEIKNVRVDLEGGFLLESKVVPLKDEDGRAQGACVISIPIDSIIQAEKNALTLIVVVLIFLSIAAASIGIIFSRRISIPLRILSEETKALAKGEVPEAVEIGTRDEIGELAQNFNRMAMELSYSEKNLRQSNESLKGIIENMLEALLVFDKDFTVRIVNGAFLRLLGYENIEVVGQSVFSFLNIRNSLSLDEDKKELEGLFRQDCFVDKDLFFLSKQKEYIPVNVNGKKITSTENERQEMVLIARDLRFEKRAREMEILNKKLEDVNQEMENFTYIVSHDLKAPIMNIKGFSDKIKETLGTIGETAGKTPSEYFSFIDEGIKKISLLVQSLLKLSRVTTEPRAENKIDLNQNLTSISKFLSHALQEKKLQLVIHPLPSIVGDEVRVNEIFTNLIDNAIKYMDKPTGGIIEVGCEELFSEYKFFVKDNGKGIHPKNFHRIFQVFQRLEPQVAAGMGMGLTIVKKIVTSQGGNIWVESEPDSGTKFYFTIPKKLNL